MGIQSLLPAQPMQSAIAAIRTVAETAHLYVDSRTVQVDDGLDVELVRTAWSQVHSHFDALRSRIVVRGEQTLVIVEDSLTPVYDGVDARSRTEAVARGAHTTLVDRHARAVRAEHGAALAHSRTDSASYLTLTWRHEILDGPGAAVVLDALRTVVAGGVLTPQHPLADVAREILARPPIEVATTLGEAPARLSSFGVGQARPVLTESRRLRCDGVKKYAQELGTTPAVVVSAAWMTALSETCGTDGFVLMAEDARPPGAAGTPGVFSGLSAAWRPPGLTTFSEVVGAVHRSRSSTQERRPVEVGTLLRPLWDAGALGVPDVVLTIHPTVARHGAGGWRQVSAVEETEFALSIDMVLDLERPAAYLHRDPGRVSASVTDQLVDRAQTLMNGEDAQLATVDVTSVASPEVSSVDLDVVLALCQRHLGTPQVGPDTDLVAWGLSSLELMRLAAKLVEAGVAISVSQIMELKTPAALVLAGADQDETGERPAAASVLASALERSRLARTLRDGRSPDEMHEQSAITVAARLEPVPFQRALGHVGDAVGVVNLVWEESPLGLGRSEVPSVDYVECGSKLEAEAAVQDWLRRDLQRGFAPGDCLFRSGLVVGPEGSTLVSGWHAAVLDGWSTAMLFRLLQDSYVATTAGGSLPARPGAHVDDYRSWSRRHMAASSSAWASSLAGSAWPRTGPQPTGRTTSQPVVVGPFTNSAAPGTSAVAGAVADVAMVVRQVLALPENEPVGLRIGLRPPQIRGSVQMIGQVTFDAPLRLDPEPATQSNPATCVQAGIVRAWAHGHAGEVGVRASAGCPPEAELFRVLIVPEDEIPEDEWVARHADHGSWQEVSSWRRDVSPSTYAVFLRTGDGNLTLEVSTSQGDPYELCVRLADLVRRRREER